MLSRRGSPAIVSTTGSNPVRRGEPRPPRAGGSVRGKPAHAPSVAPGAGPSQMDVSPSEAWPARTRSGGGGAQTRLAGENPRWGYLRIRGELLKLGITVSATAIRTVLRRHHLGPAPRRMGPSWREFLRSQAHAILALDFFTVRRLAPHAVRALHHRARVQTGARPRRHQEPRFGVGHAAGLEPRGGRAASRHPVPDP